MGTTLLTKSAVVKNKTLDFPTSPSHSAAWRMAIIKTSPISGQIWVFPFPSPARVPLCLEVWSGHRTAAARWDHNAGSVGLYCHVPCPVFAKWVHQVLRGFRVLSTYSSVRCPSHKILSCWYVPTNPLQPCPTLCTPMDDSPQSSSVHGIF